MVTVYTKVDGMLAAFKVETADVEEARKEVQLSMTVKHRGPVLALVNGGNSE